MLSCDRIESGKFIHGILSLAKLVYYNIMVGWFYGVSLCSLWENYQRQRLDKQMSKNLYEKKEKIRHMVTEKH